MTIIQPSLPADFPEPEPSDYDTWAAEVRPTFVEVARSGRRHWLCWEIRRDYKLPDPPDPAHDWGRFLGHLADDGLIEHDGFGRTRDKSVVNAWTGTRAARKGRAA
jgi:hypothetical protein